MSDVRTSAVSYCTPAAALQYLDARLVADCVLDDDVTPRPGEASLLDPAHPAGARFASALLAASGELESSCLRAGLYTPEVLAGLTGATRAHLERVVAGLAYLVLAGRRQPGTARPDDLPAVQVARELLEAVRQGEKVFGNVPNLEAGDGFLPTPLVLPDGRRTVERARRFFGDR